MSDPEPLVLCMENAGGEEVSLHVEHNDNFRTFLDKAKSVLGYEIDLTSITKDQKVDINDNAYQFLMKLDLNETDTVQFQEAIDSNGDQLYVLDDGTQIRASQIHFDNEDELLDLTLETLPFEQINEIENEVNATNFEDVNYKIVASPIPSTNTSPKHGFMTTVPFKLICNNTTEFEAQFTKYIEQSTKTYTTLNNAAKKNKSPRSLIKDNFKDKEFRYTREEILNILKDSPVTSIPYEVSDRKHVRKMDPTRMVQKSSVKTVDIEGLVIGDGGSKICFICGLNVIDKVYIFDKEDQKIHRRSPQKNSAQLKVICQKCLNENFKPSRMKGANQFLNCDEYLVIRNNQQYIFQKIKHFKFRTEEKEKPKVKKEEFVKVEIGSDGEIVTKPIDNDDVIIVDKAKDSSSDVEVVETELDKIIDNLEEADEDVKEFLGKYECDALEPKVLKCRFCELVFSSTADVIAHGKTHKHELEDSDVVYPCPLCDYGYPTYKWLCGHIKAAHENVKFERNVIENEPGKIQITSEIKEIKPHSFSDMEKEDQTLKDGGQKIESTTETEMVIKTEVKTECLSSDEEIWIVQAADDAAKGNCKDILEVANVDTEGIKHESHVCNQLSRSEESLSSHKKVKKRKCDDDDDDNLIRIPTQEDFIRRAVGRPRVINTSDVQKHRKKTKEFPVAQIVTCHNCNKSFTSKVRLKFHLQFHSSTPMLPVEGHYTCTVCGRVFGHEAALFDHVHFQHEKRKRWQCPVWTCGKTFRLRATLTKHSRSHTDTRRYGCLTCGKRFLDKQTLDEHSVTHLRIKPYQCHICLKQLTRVSRLRMHVRAHQQEPAPSRLPACTHCDRAFANIAQAQEHALKSKECMESVATETTKEPVVADPAVQLSPTSGIVRHTIQVIESPRRARALVRHEVASPAARALLRPLAPPARRLIRIVEIEKAFRCEYCEDVFYIEEGLNRHRAIHKGVKNPFTCHICKVSFATYSSCTTHKTTHGFYKRTADGQAAPVLGYGDFPTVKHFLCEDCGRSYLHWTYLQVHRRLKHPNENFLYKCNQCEMTFPNSWSLAYHRKKLHSKPLEQNVDKTVQNYRIPCRDCDEILPNKTALYKHRKKEHSGVSVQNINSGFNSNQARNVTGSTLWQRPRPHTAVIEVQGGAPTSEEIMNILSKNNILQNRVVEINTITFAKGTSSIVPNTMRALLMLQAVPHGGGAPGPPPRPRAAPAPAGGERPVGGAAEGDTQATPELNAQLLQIDGKRIQWEPNAAVSDELHHHPN